MFLFQLAVLTDGGEDDRRLIRGWAKMMGVGQAGSQAGGYGQGIQAN